MVPSHSSLSFHLLFTVGRIGLRVSGSRVDEDVGSITVTIHVLSDGIGGETTVGLSTVSGTATGELASQLQCCHGYSIVIVIITVLSWLQ